MNFHNNDGRVFEDPDGEWSPGKDTQVGDFAWFEEDILLVVKVEGSRADTIDHPAAAEMMAAVLGPNHPKDLKAGFALATRIHWRYLGRRCAELQTGDAQDVQRRAEERLQQHQENLTLWKEPGGLLVPTEPDPDERWRMRDRLKTAIHELATVLGEEPGVEVS